MKFYLTFFFALVVSLSGVADEKSTESKATALKENLIYVCGNVKDINTGELLTGVEVKLEGTDKKTYTDFEGNFSFSNVVPGVYNISLSYISYEKINLPKQTLDGKNDMFELNLHPLN